MHKIPILFFSLFVVACQPAAKLKKPTPLPNNLPSYTIDQAKYDQATPSETSIAINLAEQKARLLNKNGEVLIKSDVSTGKKGKETPRGSFKVLERIVKKRSNKYGQYVDKNTREVVIAKAWEHQGARPKGTVYQGIAMPYWMRLTWDGIGMHVGGFQKGVPSSFGCIRVPAEIQPYFYNKTKLGTRILIK